MAEEKPTGVRGKPFQKGKSGNPGGRPKELEQVKELAREHTPEAIKTLAKWMKSNNPKAAVASAIALLDRAWGKPSQQIDLGNANDKPLKFTLSIGPAGDRDD